MQVFFPAYANFFRENTRKSVRYDNKDIVTIKIKLPNEG